jgi:hypothetical protein
LSIIALIIAPTVNQGGEMEVRESKFDIGEAFIAFMVAFWPLLLVLGLIDHFFLSEHDLRLASLGLAGAAGWINLWLQRRKAERLALLEESQ